MRNRSRRHLLSGMAAALILTLGASTVVAGATAKTKRVSVTGGGVAPNGQSNLPDVSNDGRYIGFVTTAKNLAPGDNDAFADVYVRDQRGKATTWVSYPKSSINDGSSVRPAVSADGRFIAFDSESSQIIDGDTNGFNDVFINVRATRKNKRISVSSSEKQAQNGHSWGPAISANGRFVAFQSDATNLVSNDTNGLTDIFVRDRKNGKTRRVSVKSNGKQAKNGPSYSPSISANGRYVAFVSGATNLVGNDTNKRPDIFVHDRWTGVTRRVSLRSNGAQAKGPSQNPSLSANGRYVAFDSTAPNLVKRDSNDRSDVFVHDRVTRKTRRVSVKSNERQANDDSFQSHISGSARWVTFVSLASNLVGNDTNIEADVFLRDRKKGRTRLISVATGGNSGNQASGEPAISGDGRFVVLASSATDLIAVDDNARPDVFRRGPLR